MSGPPGSTVSARGLGRELRELRLAAGLSVRKVGELLDWQASKISRMETGKYGTKPEDVASLLALYGVTSKERSRLLKLAERGDEPGWWEVARTLSRESKLLIRLESEASCVFEFQPLLIPGLLQTPDYARAVMKFSGVEGADAETRIAARLSRQTILTRDEPPSYHAIVDETVIRRTLGSKRVMVHQLRRMLEAAEQPNVTLQVVPFSHGGYAGLNGSFVLLDFVQSRSVVCLEQSITGTFLEEADQLAFYRRRVESLEAVAMSTAKSADFVARVATEYERGEGHGVA
jgi:transcriptional regulator with XRE-family HTH domain